MKKAILSVALIAAGLLSGCSSEESVSRPETVGQTGTLTFSFPAPRQSITYAIGDATEPETDVPATPGEIEINDITIYMFKNSGNPDEELLVARKTASATETGDRQVKFDVDKFATGGNNYVFYAVANAGGNFTDNFVVSQTTLNDFTTAVTSDTGDEPVPGSNMLMAGYVTIENLAMDTPPSQTINLHHRVARFDVDNLADDGNDDNNNLDPNGGGGNASETFFEITKIHVINTLSSGYLTEEDNTNVRTELEGKAPRISIPVDVETNYSVDPVEGAFYLWPGKLADRYHYTDEGSTVIEVEGIYTGDGKAKVSTVFLSEEKEIKANKRYTLKVRRISQTTLTFELLASDWGDDGEMTADPTAEYSFVYSGFELLVGGEDESVPVVNNTVDLSGNTGDSDNELRFYTEGDSNGTGALTATLDLTLGTDYGASNVTPVPDGDPVVTYSIGKVRQYYKITLPKTTYPVEGTLTIKDGETQLEQVLDITSVPKYENTDYTPVLVRGKYSGPDKDDEDRYWAPVNVGATSTSYSTTEAGRGHYFQWGRNVPFTTYNSSNDTYPNPVTVETPPENYANKFIISATAPNDWLDPKDDTLWQGANAQGPCPAGWRVPTETEFTVLGSKSTGNLSSNTRLTFSGVNSTYLYLPAAGFRDNTGGWSNTASWGRYWSSTFTEDKAKSFYFLSNQINIGVDPRAMGLSVRCIQKEAVKNEE